MRLIDDRCYLLYWDVMINWLLVFLHVWKERISDPLSQMAHLILMILNGYKSQDIL
jgi:hypothetical protein